MRNLTQGKKNAEFIYNVYIKKKKEKDMQPSSVT